MMMGMSPRLLRPRASGGFNPKSITGLQLWLDASDASTITLNGSTVSEWRDKSGNARHVLQSTASLQPSYVTNGINGRPAVAPDGEDDRLSLASSISAFEPKYVAGAFKPISDNGGPWVKVGGDYDGIGLGQGATTLDSNGYNIVVIHEAIAWKNSGLAMTQNDAVVVSYEYETSLFRSHPYGSADLSDSAIISATNISIGGYLFRYSDGYVGEVLIYNRVLGEAERSKVEKYLGAKWGVAIS